MKNPLFLKIRTKKLYPEAHNHIILGFTEITNTFNPLQNKCSTHLICLYPSISFHFSKAINYKQDVRIGENYNRIVPISNIEIAHPITDSFYYYKDFSLTSIEIDINQSSQEVYAVPLSYKENYHGIDKLPNMSKKILITKIVCDRKK